MSTMRALAPSGKPTMFELACVDAAPEHHFPADVRDQTTPTAAMREAAPELVLHLAAQALVHPSYAGLVDQCDGHDEPVRGSTCPSIAAVLIVTTDKCYENQHCPWCYRENDWLGGHDTYSASKAGAELVAHSYRNSFFGTGGPLVATARAAAWSPMRCVLCSGESRYRYADRMRRGHGSMCSSRCTDICW